MINKETKKREILFRGKSQKTNTFECGLITKSKYGNFYICNKKGSHLVDEETVGQYIGRKDKYGRKIFEDDILNECDGFIRFYEKPIVIGYGHYGFCFRDIDNNFWTSLDDREFGISDFKHFEIIGNIHDNPELLEGETK